MMVLDKEGVPRLLQHVKYHWSLQLFECFWFDGTQSQVLREYLTSRSEREFNWYIVEYGEYDYSTVQDDLERFYYPYKQTLQ